MSAGAALYAGWVWRLGCGMRSSAHLRKHICAGTVERGRSVCSYDCAGSYVGCVAVPAGKTAQNSLDWSNNIIKMVTSGSKGSFINISQVCGWI
jgi:hypothetical protein